MKNVSRPSQISRREFLGFAGLGVGTLALGGCRLFPAARGGSSSAAASPAEYDLEAAPLEVNLGGGGISTWGYSGGLPGPEIRLKEGDTLRATVLNNLPEGTSIHWHGVPLPNEMDGVPDVTQPPVKPGESFTYEFVASAPGTYTYHSHSGLQIDRGLYGPLIVEPAEETLSYDREFVLMLDDWLDGMPGTPEDTMKDLKSGGSAMGGMEGMGVEGGDTPAETPPDVVYPLYLINGTPAEEPEEFGVRQGEKVRLRLINPSGASIYRVAIAGHRMTVTHTDGQPVEPVEADVIRIGMGERYDVLVETNNPGIWQLAAKAEGSDQLARAIFRYEDSEDAPPPADEEPTGPDNYCSTRCSKLPQRQACRPRASRTKPCP